MKPHYSPTTRDLQAVSNEAWDEFAASAPGGIDLVAEASLRRLMSTRIRQAAALGKSTAWHCGRAPWPGSSHRRA